MSSARDRASRGAVRGDGRVGRATITVAVLAASAVLAPLVAVGLALSPALSSSASAAPTTSTASTTSTSTASTTTGTGTTTSAGTTTSTSTASTTAGTDAGTNAVAPADPVAPTDPPTASAPPSPAPPVDPTIDDPGDLTTAIARLGGTGTPGDGVRVADPAAPTASICAATVTGAGSWSCTGPVRSGPQQVFTVIDTTDSSLHAADAPASDVVVPPTVTTSGPSTGGVSGTGLPGASVTVAASGTSAVRTATVGQDGTWFVSWATGTGQLSDGHVTMTATQTASTALGYRSDLTSAASTPVDVTIDRTAPDAPVVQSPAAGSRIRTQPITVAGTGESGDAVTVYIDSNPVCRATVTSGRWSCTTAGESIPDGDRSLVAGQRDPAGNFSPVSAAVSLTLAGAPVDTPPPSSTSGSTPATPRPAPNTPGAPTGGASGSGGATGGTAPGPGAGGDGTDGGTGTSDDGVATGAWSVATAYDGAVPTIQSSATLRTLLVAVIGAAAFLALVAAPLKLAVRTTRGRVGLRRARFTGRNRTTAERSLGDDAGVPAWATLGLAVAIASLLALLGTGVAAEARYARLTIAVVLGTAVLTAGVVLATRWAAGVDRHAITYRLSPWLVLAALASCVVTRSLDLSPALLLGVLVVPTGRIGTLSTGRRISTCGRSATWRIGALLVLVAVGWVLHSAVTRHGFWSELVGEFAITLCVGGIGSLVTTLIPVAGSAGAALWATSRTRYAALASIGIALAVAVYSGPAGNHVSLLVMLVGVAGCAVVGLVTWTWVRVVEPVLRG